MKNYNGSRSAAAQSDHSTPIRSVHTPATSQGKPSPIPEEPFTLQDLKQEYTRALNYIDKLKSEQSNLKSHLKLPTGETLHDESYSFQKKRGSHSKIIESKVADKRVTELEIENSELKSQVDTTLVRLSKLQREKQVLQDKLNNIEAQAPSTKELNAEVKFLSHENKVLKAKLLEVEEENHKLMKQKEKIHNTEHHQRVSQNLMRYVNYVSKLIYSMSPSSFARSCYEERFPKECDAVELLELGQFEPVLLKAYKYITDLLINLNSMTPQETNTKSFDITTEAPSQYSQYVNKQASRRDSPTSAKETREFKENFSRKKQPSQDGQELRAPRMRLEPYETVPTQKSPPKNEEDTEDNECNSSNRYESRTNLQKLIAPFEENKGYKKPLRKHARHCSSVAADLSQVQDSFGGDDGSEYVPTKKEVMPNPNWEAKHGISPITSFVGEPVHSSYSRRGRNDVESRRLDDELPEKYSNLRVKPAMEEKQIRDDEDSDRNEGISRHNQRESRREGNFQQIQTPLYERVNYENTRENSEEVFKSTYVKTRIAGSLKHEKEGRKQQPLYDEEFEKRVEHSGSIKRLKLPKEEDSGKEYKNRNSTFETRRKDVSMNEYDKYSQQEMESFYENETSPYSAYREREGQENHQKSSKQFEQQNFVPKSAEYMFGRSRSMPQNEDIIEEPYENEIVYEEVYPKEKKTTNKSKAKKQQQVYEEKYDDENENYQSHQGKEIWERKREELAKINKRVNAYQQPSSAELKGKDFNTFRVSFGRTEAKLKKSPSPNSRAVVTNIMDVPRKKRIENMNVKYDVITGKDTKSPRPQTVKAEDKKTATVKFAIEGGGPKTTKATLEKKNTATLERTMESVDAELIARE